MKLGKLRDRINKLLLSDERCRNDDKYLTILYWREYDLPGVTEFTVDDYIYRLTDPSSITRVRRAIQRKALLNKDSQLVPTNINVVIKRKMNAELWKTFMEYDSQGYLWGTIEKSLRE